MHDSIFNDCMRAFRPIVSVNYPNKDTFNFSSAANLGAAATIAGGAGSDVIAVTAAATLTDANFLNATSIETLRLTGASTITLGANAASAGIVNVSTGTGATSITDSNGITLNVDTTALANNTVLTLALRQKL